MATRPPAQSRPSSRLILLGVLVVLIFGSIFGGTKLSDASWSPNLALDLEGGTQLILTPQTDDGSQITDSDVQQAIEIIRQRVNSSGVSEAEITSQGGTNIVVALPGEPDEDTLNLVRQSAQLRFRAFLYQAPPGPIDPQALDQALAEQEEANPTDGTEGTDGSADTESAAPEEGAAPADEPATEDDAPSTESGAAPTTAQIDEAARKAADLDGDGEISDTPTTEPTSPSDQAWITEQDWYDFYTLNCTDPENLIGGGGDDPAKPLVTCATDGSSKYIVGPMEIPGTDIASASSGMAYSQAGAPTGEYAVNLKFNAEGTATFKEITERLRQPEMVSSQRNRFAIVLDSLVVSAPSVNDVIPNGEAQITGGFTREAAATMARQLSFGALPIHFEVQSEAQISATLGSEQLQTGLIAGLIGLGLVVLYSLLQYRGLALVTVTSLTVAAGLVFGTIALLSWLMGYRLSLPGVAGLIIAIGITADSFIIYFERIRDEVREGRELSAAVDQGWLRARRTVIASDMVNLLAAAVLYFLAVGSVRGFAFTLGLTTVIDLVVVFLFTHPIMRVLIRTKFFGGGHRFSGLDPVHLGSSVTAYRGAGRVLSRGEREQALSIAERKRAARQQEEAMAGAVAGSDSDSDTKDGQ
ncbi:protein translocase subunit SecD [Pseudactinotalea sp. HY160]|uniref:protein translocase subunit SecD n=1 Tax=Pseudactinotalea sp. HY160 TaxID=2654490 RepID=UPI001310FCD7|nr:protein translocase subunit SecD [Pseudactinotalea sp. HY160]